jgi:hypothetical protein
VAAKNSFDLDGGSIAAAKTDDLWRVSGEEAPLMEIRVL